MVRTDVGQFSVKFQQVESDAADNKSTSVLKKESTMSDAERRGVKRSSRELQQHLPRRPQEKDRAHNGTSSQVNCFFLACFVFL
jgi:hypothetical protein